MQAEGEVRFDTVDWRTVIFMGSSQFGRDLGDLLGMANIGRGMRVQVEIKNGKVTIERQEVNSFRKWCKKRDIPWRDAWDIAEDAERYNVMVGYGKWFDYYILYMPYTYGYTNIGILCADFRPDRIGQKSEKYLVNILRIRRGAGPHDAKGNIEGARKLKDEIHSLIRLEMDSRYRDLYPSLTEYKKDIENYAPRWFGKI